MDENQNNSDKVIDIHSRLFAKQNRNYDRLSLSLNEEFQELLRLIPGLSRQNNLDEGAKWVAFYFGVVVTQFMLEALEKEGYDDGPGLLYFSTGIHSVIEEMEEKVRTRLEEWRDSLNPNANEQESN